MIDGADALERDDIVAAKLRRRLRLAALFQIAGACHHHALNRDQYDRDQTAVGQFADADGDVNAFLQQMNVAVRQRQFDGHAAMVAQQASDDRQ